MKEQTFSQPTDKEIEEIADSLFGKSEPEKHYGFWQLCPKCDGQKKVLYPPYLPAGVESFSSSQTEWPCDICKGEGVLVRPEIKKDIHIPTVNEVEGRKFK